MDPARKATQVAGCALTLWLLLALFALFIGQTGYVISAGYWSAFESLME